MKRHESKEEGGSDGGEGREEREEEKDNERGGQEVAASALAGSPKFYWGSNSTTQFQEF